jgi:uncharacterized membrane protein
MKRLASFLKATTLGGLFVLLPLILFVGIFTKAVLGVRDTAQTLMEKMAGQNSGAAQFPILYAVLITIAISFVFGLAMTSARGRASGHWFERKVLLRLPGYAAVRAVVGGLVFVIEDHGPDCLTVYVPGSPNPGSGSVQIVGKDRVRILNVRMTDIGLALQQWGVGSAKVLAKHNETTPDLSASAS